MSIIVDSFSDIGLLFKETYVRFARFLQEFWHMLGCREFIVTGSMLKFMTVTYC